jgi:hypothetical protein
MKNPHFHVLVQLKWPHAVACKNSREKVKIEPDHRFAAIVVENLRVERK